MAQVFSYDDECPTILHPNRKSLSMMTTTYSLGPLPWSDKVLVDAVWKNFQEARQFVDEHPGRLLVERSGSLQSVLRILNGAVRSFQNCLSRFHSEAHDGTIFSRNRRTDLDAYEAKFQELLYLFASSAMTLVDQSRALNKKIQLPGYKERVDSSFASNPCHRFVQELRNDLIHVTLHQPHWQLTSGRHEESTTKFMLWPSQLSRLSKFNRLAREYVRDHPNGIDLAVLIDSYADDVREFQEWLQHSLYSSAGSVIEDYRRCSNLVNAVSSRASWNIVFQQMVLPAKRDPYQYLDQYLTQQEMTEIFSYPFKSKGQVDRIIEVVDEYGACDDELRAVIYKAFGVGDT